MNRQERDIAVANLLLEERLVDERQFEKAVADWTIHGSVPLLDHLVTAGLITATDREAFDAKVTTRLQGLNTEIAAADEADGDAYGVTVVPLNQLDENGRAATLLGFRSILDSQQTDQIRRFSEEYKVLRKLGQGGLGIVWLAFDDRLKRYVAIKEVTEVAQQNPAAISRFRREAVITGRLEHPSIVPIHQFAEESETGRAFYVMRFLGKQTLQDAITEYHERRESGDLAPMRLHHLLSAFVSVCQAIAYAHSKDVVHRDLKPENIALDAFGQVIVLDWGLAKLIGDAEVLDSFQLDAGISHTQPDKTIAGQVMGTPMYMSPEQAAGRVDEIDERTDVYGLGAILFAIVTGFAPHELSQRSLNSNSKVGQLLTAIMNQPTPKATELNSDVPEELEAICTRALASKRYARYESAGDLAEDVQRWMAGEPVSAFEEPWQKRAQRWVMTHRRLSQAIAVVSTIILVVAVTMGFVTHQNRQAAKFARIESLRAEARELELRLGSRTTSLVSHVRFMSELPPIQGIIDADDSERTTDELSVWRERLETIFRGLIRSDRDYLQASYSSVGEKVQEIVHVERNAADGSYVRVLPEGRLRSFERLANVDAILNLKPGDVFVIDSGSVDQKGVTNGAAKLTLLAATPIYDEQTGAVFGVVVIELNLERVLEALLALTNTATDAYVTDATGNIVMHHSRQRGLSHALVDRPISEVVPEMEGFFDGTRPAETRTDNSSFHAIRVTLGAGRTATVMGLVLTLDEG